MLILELLALREQDEDTASSGPIKVNDFWNDHKGNAKSFVSRSVFYVKLGDAGKYEIYSMSPDGKRQKVVVLPKDQLEMQYTMSAPDQKPDAEGFQTYRSNKKVTAIKNDDDDVFLLFNGKKVLLQKSDYLLKKVQGETFGYRILSDTKFKQHFKLNQ